MSRTFCPTNAQRKTPVCKARVWSAFKLGRPGPTGLADASFDLAGYFLRPLAVARQEPFIADLARSDKPGDKSVGQGSARFVLLPRPLVDLKQSADIHLLWEACFPRSFRAVDKRRPFLFFRHSFHGPIVQELFFFVIGQFALAT